jgi:hypothetical protein
MRPACTTMSGWATTIEQVYSAYDVRGRVSAQSLLLCRELDEYECLLLRGDLVADDILLLAPQHDGLKDSLQVAHLLRCLDVPKPLGEVVGVGEAVRGQEVEEGEEFGSRVLYGSKSGDPLLWSKC